MKMRTPFAVLLVLLVTACSSKEDQATRWTAMIMARVMQAYAPVSRVKSFLQLRDFAAGDARRARRQDHPAAHRR
jgi:uncharacterized lipoprotein YmbA